jgi:hypothetical protein
LWLIVNHFDMTMCGSPVHRIVAIAFIGPVLKAGQFSFARYQNT